MAQDHVHASFNSEQTWRDYVNVRAPTKENKARYVRINPLIQEDVPKLDAKESMRRLQETTHYLIDADPQIANLAKRLVAACFYFDTYGDVKQNVNFDFFEVAGMITDR